MLSFYRLIRTNRPLGFRKHSFNHQSELEKDPMQLFKMDNSSLKNISFHSYKRLVSIRPFVIIGVPDHWKQEILESQQPDFYTEKTLDDFYNVNLTSDFFNKYFGHIKLYEVFTVKLKRIHCFNKKISDSQTEYRYIPENSLTWYPDRIARQHNLQSYVIKEVRLPDNKKIKIDPLIWSVIIIMDDRKNSNCE